MPEEVFDLMRVGNQNRAVTSTNMNEGSSRLAIFSLNKGLIIFE